MPGNLLTADANLPDLTGSASTEEKLQQIAGYLYTLLEQLRYTLNNLGQENFNDTELKTLGETITGPLSVQVESAQKGLSELQVQAGEISTRVAGVEGSVSSVTQKATEIETKVTNLNNDFSTVKQTVEGLSVNVNGDETLLDGSKIGFFVDTTTGKKLGAVLGVLEFINNQTHKPEKKVALKSMTGNWPLPLKLLSAGNSSYEASGNVVIQAGYFDAGAEGYNQTGRVQIKSGDSKWFEFKSDGIYLDNKKITN